MLPELKLQPLRCVLAIIDQGGFHAAAKHLHRSQPAISMAVGELESRLGQALFEKGSGKARLTPFGQWCEPRFRELVAHHDRLSRDALAMASHQVGRVDIAAVPSVASRLMPDILASFVVDYPGIEINLHDGNSELVRSMVLKAEVDLGITSLWQAEEGLDFTPLLQDAVGVVCRDDHPLADCDPLHWRELSGHTLIRNGTSRLLEGSPAAGLLTHSTLYVSNMISLTAMLEAGIGITTLPRLAFQEERRRLRFIALAEPLLERRIGLLSRTGVSLSPAAQAMRQHVMARLDHSRSR
ncbi:LysR family transcriptional regulator [Halomonas urumqiensis]|uniref:LysR family transcriptional regulator n=1 Tax=Halomonas urumqiensis TaxID=1684789 RepID=A0A2N7UCA5_9GAMM|nr:LysR family transcriptional regulator [Halomonas urumqiensis]PMR78035.1 LysR family transcriptional regulator [Halomonas urumqiensis]PTB03186.1 LysR family transcriptional regulator [Halomonas urumqiensis]GHE20667.1 LysR family transcriptional regulator [Halomonas urumqiensis]